jgi:hypothetical protein
VADKVTKKDQLENLDGVKCTKSGKPIDKDNVYLL